MNFLNCVHVFISVISWVTLTLCQHDTEFFFSKVALQMPENIGRREYRLTWFLVPHLYEGDRLFTSICLKKSTIVEIQNITYSNDGGADKLVVDIDGSKLGEFTTPSEGDWGRLWDKRRHSGFIGRTGMLPAGQHNITIRVNFSDDCYGVELWGLYIRLFTVVDRASFWCDSGYQLAPRKWECLTEEERLKVGGKNTYITTTTTPTSTLPPNYVTITQNSFKSNCLDKKNVNIRFRTRTLKGATVSVRQEHLPLIAESSIAKIQDTTEPRFCDSDIWQIGEVDGDNKEFGSVYPGKAIELNISYVDHPEQIFPGKLLPFVTSDITIHFIMPKDLKMAKGSAFLALGLVNLTKPVDVGLRYFDTTLNAFSDIHILQFTPQFQVMGWSIPRLGDSSGQENAIHLHFQSEANIIMFDFLKLQYSKRDERKYNSLIARTGKWRVRGLRYADTKGMKVIVDNQHEGLDIEDVLLLYQMSDFGLYDPVLRVHSNGMFFPYKTFPVHVNAGERMVIDVSGVIFSTLKHSSTVTGNALIRSLHIDTPNDAIIVNYQDGSVLHLILTATPLETKLTVMKYDSGPTGNVTQTSQDLTFISTHVNADNAGVNNLFSNGRDKNVLDNLDILSGNHKYTFKKSSTNTVLYTNNVFEITFK